MILTCIFWAFVVLSLTIALVVYDCRASSLRRERLQRREPASFNVWKETNPGIEPKLLKKIIDVIASGIDVEGEILLPDDQFRGSLALQGQFIIDDQTIDSIAEEVKLHFGVDWQEKWKTVGEAVNGIVIGMDRAKRDSQ